MGRCWKDHIYFVIIIKSLKCSLFKVGGQHFRDTQNLVHVGPEISEVIHGYTYTHTLCFIYVDDDIETTVDAGYKNTFGSRKICSYNRYKLYSKYENRLPEDGSYIQNVFISGVLRTGIHCNTKVLVILKY